MLLQLQEKAKKYDQFELPYVIFASHAPDIDKNQWEQFKKSLSPTLRLGICLNLHNGTLNTEDIDQTAGTLDGRIASVLVSGCHPTLDSDELSFSMEVTPITDTDNHSTYYALLDCLGQLP